MKLRAACALLVGLTTLSCIERRPAGEPVATGAPAPTSTPAPALDAPTGKYGQVKGTELAPGGIRSFAPQGKTERVGVAMVPVEGQPFTEALRAEVKEKSGNVWDVQVRVPVSQAVAANDVILASFWVKTERGVGESAEGQTELVMELAREPWSKSVSYPVRAGSDWKQVFVRFKAQSAYAAGESQLIFRLGYEPQTILIGGLKVENFGRQLALADLPTTKITYSGMEPEAPWRKAAAERIEKVRKEDFSVVVLDAKGKPLTGAEVSLRQTKQAFGFGSAVVAQKLNSASGSNRRYQELVSELFNIAVFENNLKWPPLAGDWGEGWTTEAALQATDWLAKRGIQTRGHVLVWPSFRNSPRSLKALEKDPTKLRAAIAQHVTDLATKTRGKLVHWDVMNEPFDNHDFMDILGQDVMIDWFKLARAADPGVKLFINDYAILSGGGGETAHRAHYEKTIEMLLGKGAPIDGIGMQGHFGAALTGPEEMLKILDRYAKFGKQIWVTEYDVDLEDEALAAQFTRDFYTTLFSHPAVGGILMWGFWDGAHWHRNAPLYREDWSLKPAGEAYRELVLKTWRTNEGGKTDAQGAFKSRGFLGNYEVKVSAGGRTKTLPFVLEAGRGSLTVKLD